MVWPFMSYMGDQEGSWEYYTSRNTARRDRDWTKSKIFRLLKFYLIFVKDTVKRIKITIHELREKTFKIYINKGLLSKIYKNALKN